MNLKLINLKLTNFKGIKSFILGAQGKNINVFADNAMGKTTIYDAFLWLLFDKDSAGNTAFGIKTRDAHGNEIQMIDHAVEVTIEIDGNGITLKKIYREKWVKKRGRVEPEFSGHETLYEIAGVEKTKAEYTSFISTIADEQLLRIITSPTYYNEQIKWQDRRKLLIETLGDVKDGDVIAANQDQLEELGKLLVGGISIDDLKRLKKAEQKRAEEGERQDGLKYIPAMISEAMKAMPNVTGNAESLAAQAEKIAGEIESLRTEKLAAGNGGAIQKLKQQIAEVDTAIAQERAKHAACIPDISVERKKVNVLHDELQICSRAEIFADLERHERALVDRSKELFDKWQSVKTSTFSRDGVCPTCQQEYPESLLDVFESDFNVNKAKELEQISNEGKANGVELDKVRKQIVEATERNKRNAERREVISAEIAELESAIKRKQDVPPFESLPEYHELQQRKHELEAELQASMSGPAASLEAFDSAISAKQAELDDINRQITLIETAATQRDRIEELKAKQRELATKFEASEKVLNMIDIFEQQQADMLDEQISEKFGLVRWKLTEKQVNGTIIPTCVCTVGGVPYQDLNNAAKIQAGCDIINTISSGMGVSAPVFVDNAESITTLPDMGGQVIRLVVSEPDKELRVELVD